MKSSFAFVAGLSAVLLCTTPIAAQSPTEIHRRPARQRRRPGRAAADEAAKAELDAKIKAEATAAAEAASRPKPRPRPKPRSSRCWNPGRRPSDSHPVHIARSTSAA